MAINLSLISPTKTFLLEYKSQLEFTVEGHSLLEEKREILVMHLLEIASKIKEQRKNLNDILLKSYAILRDVTTVIGEQEINNIINSNKILSEIEIQERRIMGVNIPVIRYLRKIKSDSKPEISFFSTNSDFDALILNIRKIIQLIIQVAQTEASAWRLAYEIKKTQRRVNALENIFIPDFKEVIKFIQDSLDERERETFFQMKRIKGAQEKRKKRIGESNG